MKTKYFLLLLIPFNINANMQNTPHTLPPEPSVLTSAINRFNSLPESLQVGLLNPPLIAGIAAGIVGILHLYSRYTLGQVKKKYQFELESIKKFKHEKRKFCKGEDSKKTKLQKNFFKEKLEKHIMKKHQEKNRIPKNYKKYPCLYYNKQLLNAIVSLEIHNVTLFGSSENGEIVKDLRSLHRIVALSKKSRREEIEKCKSRLIKLIRKNKTKELFNLISKLH